VGNELVGRRRHGFIATEMPGRPRHPTQLVDELSVAPWLYGNWWRENPLDPSLRLMGLGVRLAIGPNVEDAVWNNTEFHAPEEETMRNILWIGSHLRIRTLDGTLF